MKPGPRTTEFWVTIATVVGVVTAALASALSPRYAALATAISVAAYAISRGLAKIGPPAPATVPPPPPATPAPPAGSG